MPHRDNNTLHYRDIEHSMIDIIVKATLHDTRLRIKLKIYNINKEKYHLLLKHYKILGEGQVNILLDGQSVSKTLSQLH